MSGLMETNELKSPCLLIGFVSGNATGPATWFDDFIQLTDKANDHKA